MLELDEPGAILTRHATASSHNASRREQQAHEGEHQQANVTRMAMSRVIEDLWEWACRVDD